MKNFKFTHVFTFLAMLSLVLTVAACSNDDEPEVVIPITLTGNMQTLTFPAFNTSMQLVTVETNAPRWEFACDASWINISKYNSMTLTVEADENSVLESKKRTGTITVTAEGYEGNFTLNVSQDEGYSIYGYWMALTLWDGSGATWNQATKYPEGLLIYRFTENGVFELYISGELVEEYPFTYNPVARTFNLSGTECSIYSISHTDLEIIQPTTTSPTGLSKLNCVKILGLP